MAEVLYNKYRPRQFEDLIGLSITKKILTNCLKTDQIPHAWLFYGPRGTGKTTTARIFAAAINSETKVNGFEPNPKEEIVKSIFEGSSLCLSEVDAASNRSVGDVENLQEEMRFSSPDGKKKVYVIDEVHMLSKAAFNALLKTMEDPPEHVMFILATTNPEKVPETIRSRCQNLAFHAHRAIDLNQLIIKISKKEKIKMEKGVEQLMSYISEGSARDALGNLEKLSTFSEKNIKLADAFKLFGLSDIIGIETFIESLLEKDSTKCLIHVEKLFNTGISIWPFLDQTIEYFHNILIYKKIKNYEGYYRLKNGISEKWKDDQIFIVQNEIIELKKSLKWEREGLTLWRIIAFNIHQKINGKTIFADGVAKRKTPATPIKEPKGKENANQPSNETKPKKQTPATPIKEPKGKENANQPSNETKPKKQTPATPIKEPKDKDWEIFLKNLQQADLHLWILLNKKKFIKWEDNAAFISVDSDSIAWKKLNQNVAKKVIETVSNTCLKKKIELKIIIDKEPILEKNKQKNNLNIEKEIKNLGIEGEWDK